MTSRRILVGYVTRTGYTRTVAGAIATRLEAGGNEVDLADLELCTRHPERYDAIVLGSPIRHGHHAEGIMAYIRDHREELGRRIGGFFSVDHLAYASAEADPGGHLDRLFTAVGWRPAYAVAVAGLLDYREHAWPRRLWMKWRSSRRGWPTDTTHDHRLTDWPKLAAFADDVAAATGAAPACARPDALPPFRRHTAR